MKTHTEIQGTQGWLELRSKHHTASEASAMMGASKYQTRDELLAMKKHGVTKEITPHTQKLFDKGHAAEAAIRPVIEKLISKDLYPVTGSIEITENEVDDLGLLASFDGLTMLEDINFEHKLWNEKLAQSVRDNDLDPHYYWQLEQQMLVSGAEKSIFVVSDGTEENMVYCWYEPVPGRAKELIAGWHQFDKDFKNYEYIENAPAPEIAVIGALPALMIELSGEVKNSNIALYEEKALSFIQNINSDLNTDEDFANAAENVKFCEGAEKHLALVKQQALSQTEDIRNLFATVDRLSDELRTKRLALDKLVTARKASIKSEIINNISIELQQHVDSLNHGLEGNYISVAEMGANFPAVIKGKRTMQSIRGAVNDELARVKILGNAIADEIRANLKTVEANKDYNFLFNDLHAIVRKAPDDFTLLANARISEHKQREADKETERLAEEARKKEAEKPVEVEPESKLSESSQEFVDEIEVAEAAEPVKKPTAKEAKALKADIKKLKVYLASLNDFEVPALTDKKCVEISAAIIAQLTKFQDRVNEIYPENGAAK